MATKVKSTEGADEYLLSVWNGKKSCQFHLEYKLKSDTVHISLDETTMVVDMGVRSSDEDDALHKSTYTRLGNGAWVTQHSYEWSGRPAVKYEEEDIKGSTELKELYGKFGITKLIFKWQNK